MQAFRYAAASTCLVGIGFLCLFLLAKQVLNVLGRLLVSGHAVGLCPARGFQDVGTLLSIVPDRLVEVLDGKDCGDIVFPSRTDEGVDAL